MQRRLFFHSNRDFILFFRPRRNQPRKRISRQVMLSFQEKLFSKCFRANSMNHNDKQVSPCSLECPFSCNHTPRQTGSCLFLLFGFWGWQFIIHCMKQACQKFLIINFIYQQHLFCSLIGQFIRSCRHITNC